MSLYSSTPAYNLEFNGANLLPNKLSLPVISFLSRICTTRELGSFWSLRTSNCLLFQSISQIRPLIPTPIVSIIIQTLTCPTSITPQLKVSDPTLFYLPLALSTCHLSTQEPALQWISSAMAPSPSSSGRGFKALPNLAPPYSSTVLQSDRQARHCQIHTLCSFSSGLPPCWPVCLCFPNPSHSSRPISNLPSSLKTL